MQDERTRFLHRVHAALAGAALGEVQAEVAVMLQELQDAVRGWLFITRL